MKIETKGDTLILTVDISKKAIKNARLSKKKNNKLLATTSGFQGVGPEELGLRLSINVIAPLDDE